MTPEASSRNPIRQVRWVGKTAVVEAAGEIDLNCSLDFQQALLQLMDQRPAIVVINLAAVSYMDSSGVASLVKLLSRVRKAGVLLRLAAMSDRVRSVFEITRLDSVFDIRNSEQEALA